MGHENTLTASLLAGTLLFTCGHGRTDAQPVQTFSEVTAAVDRLLQSNDATEVAWGAFTASQYHVVSAIPRLTAALGRGLDGNLNAARAAELGILDALVQLDAEVPVDVLRPSLGRWPIPTLILVNNAIGDRDALLLDRFSATSGFEWQAIANLLLKSKPPGFAAKRLDGLGLRVTVSVTDDPSRGRLVAGVLSGVESGPNNVSGVPGFPPLADYQLVPARQGATILSVGPRTAYYVRHVQNSAVIPPVVGSRVAGASDADRVEYLNALVRERFGTAALRDTTSVTVVWTNPQAFRQDISVHRKRVEDLYRQVISLLALSKRLTDHETRGLAPNITITVEDNRSDKSESLPAIEERGPAVAHLVRKRLRG
jgi:hypothetical protein